MTRGEEIIVKAKKRRERRSYNAGGWCWKVRDFADGDYDRVKGNDRGREHTKEAALEKARRFADMYEVDYVVFYDEQRKSDNKAE